MTVHYIGGTALGWLFGIITIATLRAASPTPEPIPICIATASVVTRTVPVPVEVEVHVTDPTDCALLAMARIASQEGSTVGRARWRIAQLAGSLAETCDEATALVALTRQESTWNAGAVSHAGACGVTQVRSCDAPGTFDVACCDRYTQGGHHCRPRCEWLLDPANALGWTLAWLRDRNGWDPERYVGARDASVGAGYVRRAEEWRRLAQGDTP